jgi:acetylornithine deacetylase/succinyl-diaminopimelate desuccinylase-like protein
MKAGLTAVLFAVRALARSCVPLGGDVLLASVQGEEDGGSVRADPPRLVRRRVRDP